MPARTYVCSFRHTESGFVAPRRHLSRPRSVEGELERAVEEAGSDRFRLGDVSLDDDYVFELFSGAPEACPWTVDGGEVVFPDGSVLDDWGRVVIEVKDAHLEAGSMTNARHYDVTLTVPPEARYKPEGRQRSRQVG